MNPLAVLEPERTPQCASDLVLDRYLASELSSDEEAAFVAHVHDCARCTARRLQRVMELQAWQAAPLAPRAQVAHKRRPSPRALLAAGGALAMAAAAFLIVRPVDGPDTTRTKGTRSIGFYVKQGENVRRGAQGEVVAPGDALRFVYTSEQPGYFAVLSVDGARRASIYYPGANAQAASIQAGRDVPLPLSTVLDDVLGEEALLGVFCEQPIDLEPLRAALEQDARAAPPPGCSFDRLSIQKVPR